MCYVGDTPRTAVCTVVPLLPLTRDNDTKLNTYKVRLSRKTIYKKNVFKMT